MGQNEDEIAVIIRNDNVASLSKMIRLNPSLLNATIRSSRYETFDFGTHFGKRPSLIEYSAFFASLECFKFLLDSNASITDTTPEFAVAGGNIEIIHRLEALPELEFSQECVQASVEFFRPELFEYFTSTKGIEHSIFDVFDAITHFNFELFGDLISIPDLQTVENLNKCLFVAVESQTIDVIEFLLHIDCVDINSKTDYGISLFLFLMILHCL